MAKKKMLDLPTIGVGAEGVNVDVPHRRLCIAIGVLEARAHKRMADGEPVNEIEEEVRNLLERWLREDVKIEENNESTVWILVSRWSAESV